MARGLGGSKSGANPSPPLNMSQGEIVRGRAEMRWKAGQASVPGTGRARPGQLKKVRLLLWPWGPIEKLQPCCRTPTPSAGSSAEWEPRPGLPSCALLLELLTLGSACPGNAIRDTNTWAGLPAGMGHNVDHMTASSGPFQSHKGQAGMKKLHSVLLKGIKER